jgi:DNA-binding transcriptional ArsR family regulator
MRAMVALDASGYAIGCLLLTFPPTWTTSFDALADPARPAIVDRLSLGPASVSELV